MDRIITWMFVAVMLFGCAGSNKLPNSACDPSLGQSQKSVIGVVGIPAATLTQCIKASDIQVAPDTDISSIIKDKGLDYLLIVKTDKSTEQRNDVGHSVKKAGLFAASLLISAVSRSATNLNHDSSTRSNTINIVSTTAEIYGSDGKLKTIKTDVKEFAYSEEIPGNVAIDAVITVLNELPKPI